MLKEKILQSDVLKPEEVMGYSDEELKEVLSTLTIPQFYLDFMRLLGKTKYFANNFRTPDALPGDLVHDHSGDHELI